MAVLRVSTDAQGESGAGLAAQRAALAGEFARRGWSDVRWITDVASARSMDRPGMAEALALLRAGEADVLASAKVDRLSRSVRDLCALLEEAQRGGWTLLALDSPVDLSTPHGAAMLQVQGVFSELERRLIGQRTREALAARRAAGVRLGRPPVIPDAVAVEAARLAADGRPLLAVGRGLAAAGYLPPGGTWRGPTIRKLLARPCAQAVTAARAAAA